MGAVIFGYTIVLILVCFAAAMLSVAAYAVSRKSMLLPQAVFFVLYIVEISSILGAEFLSQNIPFSPEDYYEISMPALRIITSAGILHCLWLMLLDILDEHGNSITYIPVVCFVLLSVFVVTSLPYGALRQWLFYTLRQVFIAFGLIYAYFKWRRSTDSRYRKRLERYKTNYLLLWVLLVLTLIEDSYIILIAPIPDAESGWLMLYLSERNFSENMMMLFVAYHTIRGSLETLALRFAAPPKPDAARDDADDVMRHISEDLPAFAAKYKLSDREAEVLELVLQNKGNRAIGQQLYLSEGTIKTHVHNICRKVGVASRDELRQTFWAS